MFGIIMTVIVGGVFLASLIYMIVVIFKPHNKSISESLRDNDEKYE